MESITIPTLKLVQQGCTMYLGRMTARDLVDISKVDYWVPGVPDDRQGYQREAREARLRRIGRFLVGKLYPTRLMPGAILLNAREQLAFEDDGDGIGRLTLRSGQPLWIVDGQHRVGGLRYAIEKLGSADVRDQQLPVVITENLDRFAEMMQFFVINQEQKKIRTDLANRLLQQQARDTEGFTRLLEQGLEWKVRATALSDRLNADRDSVWLGRVQMPNQKKNPDHIIKEISFTTSLRPVVAGTSILSRLHVDQLSEVLGRYWKALAELMPEPFESPEKHVIQKTPGVFSLHAIFPLVFELARQEGRHATVEAFRDVLRPGIDAEGGAEFWEKENDDGASQFGSMKGFRILANRLESNLPRVEVAI